MSSHHFEDNHITKVAIVGAAGRIGGAFTKSLLETGKHTVTAISREDSKSQLPEGVKVAKANYDNEAALISALQGQDVLIITLSVQAPKDTESKLIAAAAKAGVPYIFPNCYSADIERPDIAKETALGEGYERARKAVEEAGVSKWIAFLSSFWYEWSLPMGKFTYGFDIPNREVLFYDDGKTKFHTSTWPQCGRAMASLLSLPVSGEGTTLSSFASRGVYISSFYTSQKEIFQSILRVTGDKEEDWKIEYRPALELAEEGRKRMYQGDRTGFGQLLYCRCLAKDGNTDFTGKLNNDVLGLKEEDLDEWTKFCVDFAKAGRSWWTE